MASAGQFVPGFGCEPVRKNNAGITPPRHTVWSPITPVADFLVKLFDHKIEYTAEDDVIQLHPPTVQHDEPIAEDPGCIDAGLFNFDEHTFNQRTGINPQQLMTDVVIDYSVNQLAQLYRINTSPEDEASGWDDEDSPGAQLCSLHKPSETAYTLREGQDVTKISEAEIVYFAMKLATTPSSVFICHWGSGAKAHYFTVGYNNATASGAKHLYVTDSNVSGVKESAVSRAFARQFRALWNRIGHPPGVELYIFFRDYSCEQQEDGKSCGFYAIHNAHRLVHAATIDGNFEQVGRGDSPFAVELGQLTPQKIRVWRAKLFKAFYEYQRQRALRITFADNATIRATPGYHPSHVFSNRFKLTMSPRARADIGYIGKGGTKVSENLGLPYDPQLLRKEKFSPNSEFARLVDDWGRDDVAGVIIRLSMSNEPSERAMYRAVRWGQTVLLSAYPVKARMSWERPPNGTPTSTRRTDEEVIQICKAEYNALKGASPGLSEAQLRLQRDFIAGQMCQATPKLAICATLDGITWAKMAWRKTVHDSENIQVYINHYNIVDTMQGAMRLGDYALIKLTGRPEFEDPAEDTSVPLSGGSAIPPLVPEAHYIWVGKWPHFGKLPEYFSGKEPWESVDLANVHPPPVYRQPEIWNWIPASGVPLADFHRTVPDAVFEEQGNPQVHFGDDAMAHSNAVNLAMNYRWHPVQLAKPPLRSVNAVTSLFNSIEASTDLVTTGPTAGTTTTMDTGEKNKDDTGDKDKDVNTEPTNGHESSKDGTETPKEPPKKIRKKSTRYRYWVRTGQTQPERVVVPPSAAAKRVKRDVIGGWKHQGVIPLPTGLRPAQNRVPFPSKMRVHADAYLTIGPPLPDHAATSELSQAHLKNKKKAYLASLLLSMSDTWKIGEGGQLMRAFYPGTGHGHFHHHHRPTKIIDDHRWRLNYFTRIDPDRFPWPPGAQKTLTVMMSVCEDIRERKQNKDPADAIEWRNFGHLLELGDKVTKLWEATPLESRQTMRCLNANCEQLRVNCLEFEGKAVKAKEWDLIERYQRWMYGAEQCPADCPLRDFDCPINCGQVHRNPMNILAADFAALTDIRDLPLTNAQNAHVVKVLDERYPSRWICSPPDHWMPVRADPGFWDHKDQSLTALNARINACENRLLEWEVLSDDERRAIMTITNIYYDDINDVINNAAWVRKSRDAQRLAREEKEIRKFYPNVNRPQALDEAALRYYKRKIDLISEDYPFSKKRRTIYGTWTRKLPKVTALDFENRLTFKYLREFW